MKKVISIALIAMLVVAMAGCSQSQPAPTAAPAETAAQTTAAPQTEAPATAAALTGTVGHRRSGRSLHGSELRRKLHL